MKNIEELEKIEDKSVLFEDYDKLLEFIESVPDFLELFYTLDDNYKLEVMEKDFFKRQNASLKKRSIESISDKDVIYNLLKNGKVKEIVDDSFMFRNMLKELPEDKKMEIIKDGVSIKKLNISSFNMKQVIDEMQEDSLTDLLKNPQTLKEIGLSDYDMPGLICKISDDKVKEEIMSGFELKRWERLEVLQSFSTEYKTNILREDGNLSNEDITKIINSMPTADKITFMKENKEFLGEKSIRVFDIVRRMKKEDQIEFVKDMSELDLSEKENKLIIAGLSNEAKDELDPNLVKEEYRGLLSLRLENGGSVITKTNQIVPDLEGDLTKYKDIGELLYVNPMEIDIEGRKKLLELSKICPDLKFHDDIDLETSSSKEFVEAEEWISSVIDSLDPDWTDIQKMAFIDTQIGKKISYSPDFDTEVENPGEQRALWKIISSGYGVCNGISQVEKYIFSRIGIESEIIGSGTHAFLKVNNVEIPTKDGTVKGDTLLDPTWNLGSNRYGGRPAHFCNDYEEIRKADIGSDGRDHNCHKSEKLEGIDLVHMDEQTVREVYKSIGIADEKGQFPIGKMIDEAEEINKTTKDIKENIRRKIELLKKACPEYAECICSTDKILSSVLFEKSDALNYDRCIVSRVYDKEDETKTPVLYTYFDFDKEGKMFFYADKDTGEFIELPQEEFEKKFDCYERDKEKTNGKRAWEYEKEVKEDLSRSSGEIEASQKNRNDNEDKEI